VLAVLAGARETVLLAVQGQQDRDSLEEMETQTQARSPLVVVAVLRLLAGMQ
jgi:hypothetical protein